MIWNRSVIHILHKLNVYLNLFVCVQSGDFAILRHDLHTIYTTMLYIGIEFESSPPSLYFSSASRAECVFSLSPFQKLSPSPVHKFITIYRKNINFNFISVLPFYRSSVNEANRKKNSRNDIYTMLYFLGSKIGISNLVWFVFFSSEIQKTILIHWVEIKKKRKEKFARNKKERDRNKWRCC